MTDRNDAEWPQERIDYLDRRLANAIRSVRADFVLYDSAGNELCEEAVRSIVLCALAAGERFDAEQASAIEGLPEDLVRVLRDPSITIQRDHDIRLGDGRTLFDHIQEWRNAPSDT